MINRYNRGELTDLFWTHVGFYVIGIIALVGMCMLNNSDCPGGVIVALAIIGIGCLVGSTIAWLRWFAGFTTRIEDTAINTSETNENLALILKELKALREVETKHKQHFDTYADWMFDTMTTINGNIIKT